MNLIKTFTTLLITASLGMTVGLPMAAFAANEGVCRGLDSGKIDVSGEIKSLTLTAPEGKLITGYCVKAGSDKQEDGGPVYVDVAPAKSVTFSHPTGKGISHYSLDYSDVVVEPTTPPTTKAPEPEPTKTTPAPVVTTPAPEVTTPAPEVTTPAPEVTTAPPTVTPTTPAPTETVSPTPSVVPTVSISPSASPTATITPTPDATTPAPEVTTPAPVVTVSPTPSATPTATNTPSPEVTSTPVVTVSPSVSASPTATTPAPKPPYITPTSPAPTVSPSPSATATVTPTTPAPEVTETPQTQTPAPTYSPPTQTPTSDPDENEECAAYGTNCPEDDDFIGPPTDVDCVDFETQGDAQEFMDNGGEYAGLDRDNDGIACETETDVVITAQSDGNTIVLDDELPYTGGLDYKMALAVAAILIGLGILSNTAPALLTRKP